MTTQQDDMSGDDNDRSDEGDGAPDPQGIQEDRPLVFISYRRVDTRRETREVLDAIEFEFGPGSVFVDIDSIRVGENWRSQITENLERCAALIVMIGDRWFSATDAYHKRRIDSDDDWVRNEIRSALDGKKPVLPVLVGGESAPPEAALPEPIKALADLQAVKLRTDDWDSDIETLHNRLEGLGFKRSRTKVAYPQPAIMEPTATKAEIDQFLSRHEGWEIQYRPDPHEPGRKRRGIGTSLNFVSFRDAIHFMSTASWGIDQRNHHPEWENIWKSVVVWITQFDIGGDITARNLELAEYLMEVYEPYRKAVSGQGRGR